MKPVADPGFPRVGGANSPGGGGRQHTILPNFPKNSMKLKEFGPRGARVPRAPLRSATGNFILQSNLWLLLVVVYLTEFYREGKCFV